MAKKTASLFLFFILVMGFFLLWGYGVSTAIKAVGMTLLFLLEGVTVFFTAYTSIIGYLGLRRPQKPKRYPPQKTFAVICAAHNEEAVIGELVDSLNQLHYPKALYDVYVICDHCSDRTAEIVREKGAIALERFNEKERGKGYALEWMFQHLWELEKKGKKYDAVAMFDADNLVSRNFLQIMNAKLLEGHEVIQGYLDTKNPNDTWITKSYAFAYWATNRVYQLSRENLGLSAQLGGTGVVVTTEILKKIGWGATSLTEDLEFTQRYILETGRRVVWAHEAKLYDEKPLDFKASWKQRIRWMQGHADCMVRYAPKMFKQWLKTGKLLYFDSLSYLLQPSKVILNLLLLVFSLLSLINVLATHPNPLTELFRPASLVLFVSLFIIFNGLTIIGVLLEKPWRTVLWTPIVYLFSLSWLPITLIGFLKRKERKWDHTRHTRAIRVEDIDNRNA